MTDQPSDAAPRDPLTDALRQLEWSGTSEHVYGCCPSCGNFPVEGHEAGCLMATVMAKVAALSASPAPAGTSIPGVEQLRSALEARSRQFHRAERERTGSFVGPHGSWMGRVYERWEECPTYPCCADRELLKALSAGPERPVKER